MTRVVALAPEPGDWVDLAGQDLRDWLALRYALKDERWLRLNVVAALGGQITGPSGTSDDLADGIDRPLLGVLRSSAQAVLVGASSVRAGGYPVPRSGPLVVATASGDLGGHAFPADLAPGALIVLCPAAATEAVRRHLGEQAEAVPLPGDPVAEPRLLLDALQDRGLDRVVCEGGGGLASRLFAARLVDEFDHSIAPVVTSPGAPLTTGDVPLVGARIAGLLRDETDRLYVRWSFPAHGR